MEVSDPWHVPVCSLDRTAECESVLPGLTQLRAVHCNILRYQEWLCTLTQLRELELGLSSEAEHLPAGFSGAPFP